jgi:hypothetical protein
MARLAVTVERPVLEHAFKPIGAAISENRYVRRGKDLAPSTSNNSSTAHPGFLDGRARR